MTEVIWTDAAESDLKRILDYVKATNPQGVASVNAAIRRAVLHISTLPRSARLDRRTGAYDKVVIGQPLLLSYELVALPNGDERAEIFAGRQ